MSYRNWSLKSDFKHWYPCWYLYSSKLRVESDSLPCLNTCFVDSSNIKKLLTSNFTL
ncbi:hypothetical protein MHBO_004203 [Bonamia ostreae]|uniref:Uncharacterized protein n=1 Tax=Bonamia ostreae TaxID=126728 RepID=A0ABV2ASN0_9EUKA